MALVNNITRRVEIPHENGEWMEIKKLSWKQLEKASDVLSDAMFDRMKKLGGNILSALRNTAREQEQDTTTKYDRATVLKMGIIKWSYDATVSSETIDQLDEETASWAFKEILDLNKPRTEEEIKND